MILKQIRPVLVSFILLSLITGVVYPLLVTCIAQGGFKNQATGSLIFKDGKAVGSKLIGQQFDDPKYLWGRLSATGPVAYNAAASSGSNYGPINPAFLDAAKARVAALHAADPENKLPIPVDLATASGSGLDPHISLAGADYQISRISKVRGLSQEAVRTIIYKNTRGRFLNLVGEPTVNVLQTNLDLDAEKK